MSRRPPIRGVLFGGILAALVATTGSVVLAGEPDASPAAFSASIDALGQIDGTSGGDALASDPAAGGSSGAEGSADTGSTDSEELTHLTAASRGEVRASLLDGEGVSFTVVVDGEEQEIVSVAGTLSDALVQAGIHLGWDDVVSADLSAPPQQDAQVVIGRANTDFVTEQIVTPFETVEKETDDLLVGETRVAQEGVDGDASVTWEITYVDGVEISRAEVVSTQLTESVQQIVEVGTREPTTSSGGSGSSSSSGGTVAATGPVDPGSNRELGREMMIAYGFAEDQWGCLDNLWTKESRWNHTASNRSSGAYGIPQALPGSKMANVGSDWRTNPATQITWGLNYISGRYETPCGAWGAFQNKGWY